MQPTWERTKTCLSNFHSIFSGSKGVSRKYFWAEYPGDWSTRNEHFPFFLDVISNPGHCPVTLRCYTHYSFLGSYTLCHCRGVVQGMNMSWFDLAAPNVVFQLIMLLIATWPFSVSIFQVGMEYLVVLLPFFVSVLPLRIHVDLSLWFASLIWFSLL